MVWNTGVFDVGIHQHHGHGELVQLRQAPAGIAAHDDDAVYAAVARDAHIALIRLRAGEQQHVIAASARRVLNGGQKLAVKRVCEHELLARLRLGDHHADQVGAAAGEAAGVQVGHIVQRAHGLPYALRGFRADGFAGFLIQHIADGRRGNARFPCHILDADAPHDSAPPFCRSLNRFSKHIIHDGSWLVKEQFRPSGTTPHSPQRLAAQGSKAVLRGGCRTTARKLLVPIARSGGQTYP